MQKKMKNPAAVQVEQPSVQAEKRRLVHEVEETIGPRIRRQSSGDGTNPPFEKAGIKDIAASETLILATAIGDVVLRGFEMKERRRLHRYLLLIAGALAVLIGLVKSAIILINN